MTYCVFAGRTYYPSEGLTELGDFRGVFETRFDAVNAVLDWARDEDAHGDDLSWWQICDHDAMKIIENGDGTCLPSL